MILHLALLAILQQTSPPAQGKSYLFFVASEGSDEVALIRFDAKGLRVEHRTPFKLLAGEPESGREIFTERFAGLDTTTLRVGRNFELSSAHGFAPGDLAGGPRNLTIDPSRRFYYVTTARGFPNGELLKVRIAGDSARSNQPIDTVQDREALSAAPGAVQITPDGSYAWVTTSTVAGDAGPSGIAVIYLPGMLEVARISTCAGARGAQFTADGSRHYSVCSGDDVLVEIDVAGLKVARRLSLVDGAARGCQPAAIAMSADESRMYVACGQASEVVEVDLRAWSVVRRIGIGAGPTDLIAVTRDSRALVVANGARQSVSVVDVGRDANGSGARQGLVITPDYRYAQLTTPSASGVPARTEGFDVGSLFIAAAFAPPFNGIAAIGPAGTMHGVPAAVAISSDDRFAFVSFGRAGDAPGRIEVFDLARRAVVASLDFGRRLSGIAFWKVQN